MNTKEKFTIEYVFNSPSSLVLWNSVSSPNGLREWFADEVRTVDDGYEFEWNGVSQLADLLFMRARKVIRFHWKDESDATYFEFKICNNELTNQVSLVVSDFAYSNELDDSKRLWDSQIEALRRFTGM